MDKLTTTWLGEFKSVIYLVLGIISVFRIPYTMPFMVFLFLVLFGMIAFFRFGEVYLLKKTENKAMDLFAGFMNLGFVIWTIAELVRYPNEDYTTFAHNSFTIISAWLIVIIVWGVAQGIFFMMKKNILGNILIIEAVLSSMLWFFFYRVSTAIKEGYEIDDRVLLNFGIFCVSLALISFLHTKVAKYVVKKQEAEE